MTIYIVTSGSYSDYSICAVYDTRELAAAHVGDRTKSYEIEEFQLNPGEEHYRAGQSLRQVVMRKNGSVLSVENWGIGWTGADIPKDNLHAQQELFSPPYSNRNNKPTRIIFCQLETCVWSKNDEQAVKVANERRTRWIAEGRWDAEVLRLKDAHEKSSYSTKYYRWDLEPGE